MNLLKTLKFLLTARINNKFFTLKTLWTICWINITTFGGVDNVEKLLLTSESFVENFIGFQGKFPEKFFLVLKDFMLASPSHFWRQKWPKAPLIATQRTPAPYSQPQRLQPNNSDTPKPCGFAHPQTCLSVLQSKNRLAVVNKSILWLLTVSTVIKYQINNYKVLIFFIISSILFL